MSKNPPKVLPPQNLLDKAIAYIAPKLALQRLQQRGMLALAGGYTGARMDRAQLAAWRTRAGSPETDLIPDLPKLRERSRDLARNAPVATGAIGTTITHVVGTGLWCSPQPDAKFLGLDEAASTAWTENTTRRFRSWCKSPDCHLERHLNFYAQQALVFRGVLESGDLFTVTPRIARNGKPPRLALQHIEADRVCNPQGSVNSDTLTEGIEHSAETGEPIRLHVMKQHPGDLRALKREWTPVPYRGGSTGRRNVLHLFRPTRPGQRRGAPMLAPIIEPLKQLARYTDAELTAAVTSGLFSVFMRMDPEAFESIFDDNAQSTYIDSASKWSGEIEAGKVVNLLPGEEPVTSNPGRPNAQFDPFTQSILKQIGMALGLPYEVLTMAYQSSYSAARGALLMAWKFFMEHRSWLADNFCQPVYELWLADEVAAGRISAPGFFADDVVRDAWCAAQWVGDGPGSIDPVKEVAAAEKRVQLGISTLQAESILHDGVDWETKHAQQVKEKQARDEAGLGEPPAQPAAAAPPEPNADEQEDPNAEDPADTPPPPTRSEEAFTAMAAAFGAIAAREPAAHVINVTTPPVTMHAGATHVTLAEGAVHTHVAAPEVHFEANMPAAAPAQVIVQQAPPTRQVVKYDPATGDVAEILTVPAQ